MRFERQIAIKQIGLAGQKKLSDSHVVVVGAGGLGSSVLTFLSCAGVGNITIIDNDNVNESNLNRQFLYSLSDIGCSKATVAAQKLSTQYPDIKYISKNISLDNKNIESLLDNASVTIDCVDNIATRIAVNDFVVSSNVALVEGAVSGFYGFVTSVVNDSACLRCFGYDNTKEQKNIPALGSVVGVIGSLQATECIKIILGQGSLITNKVLHYDGLSSTFDEVDIKKDENCICCVGCL